MSVALEVVQRLPLFRSLSEQDQAALAQIGSLERQPADARLFEQSDAPDALFVILSGRVALVVPEAGDRERMILTLGPGELLGFSALLPRPRVAGARTSAPSELLRLPAQALRGLCDRDPAVGYAIMKQAFHELAERLVDTRLQLVDMFAPEGVATPQATGTPQD